MFGGILLVILGICMFGVALWTDMEQKTLMCIIGVGFSIFGILVIIGTLLEDSTMIQFTVLISIGIMFLITASIPLYKAIVCTQVTKGIYAGTYSYGYRHKIFTYYVPTFTYTVDGTLYRGQDALASTRKTFDKQHQLGKTYDIYINPKNPNIFITSRRIKMFSVIFFLLGMLSVCLPFIIHFR